MGPLSDTYIMRLFRALGWRKKLNSLAEVTYMFFLFLCKKLYIEMQIDTNVNIKSFVLFVPKIFIFLHILTKSPAARVASCLLI